MFIISRLIYLYIDIYDFWKVNSLLKLKKTNYIINIEN